MVKRYRKRRLSRRSRRMRLRRRNYKNRSYIVKNRAYKSSYPDAFLTKISYSESFTMTGANIIDTLYRANGPYDPRYATGGGTPTDFGVYSNMYTSHYVTASSCEVKLIASGAGSNLVTSSMVVVLPSTQTAQATASPSELWDMPWAKSTIVGPAGGASHGRIKNYMTTKRFYGIPKSVTLVTDDNLVAGTGTVPNNEYFWHIIGASLDGNNLNQITAFVKITYYVMFFNRKEITF